jgi:hypothetical protein
MSDTPSVEPNLASVRVEISKLIELLPIEKLQSIRDYANQEIKRLEPGIQEAESRLNTIWKHLVDSFNRGEYAVVNDVHEFLINRARWQKETANPTPQGDTPASSSVDSHDQAVS